MKQRAEIRRAVLGRAKLALCFQIPSHASLHGILKAQRSLCCAIGPALAPRSEIFGRKCGVALGLQAGMCCEKASASGLASVFSIIDPAFAQRINPVIFFGLIRVHPGNLIQSIPLPYPSGQPAVAPSRTCHGARLWFYVIFPVI
jgi:hypothetical protein